MIPTFADSAISRDQMPQPSGDGAPVPALRDGLMMWLAAFDGCVTEGQWPSDYGVDAWRDLYYRNIPDLSGNFKKVSYIGKDFLGRNASLESGLDLYVPNYSNAPADRIYGRPVFKATGAGNNAFCLDDNNLLQTRQRLMRTSDHTIAVVFRAAPGATGGLFGQGLTDARAAAGFRFGWPDVANGTTIFQNYDASTARANFAIDTATGEPVIAILRCDYAGNVKALFSVSGGAWQEFTAFFGDGPDPAGGGGFPGLCIGSQGSGSAGERAFSCFGWWDHALSDAQIASLKTWLLENYGPNRARGVLVAEGIELIGTEPFGILSGYSDDPDTRPSLLFWKARGTKESPTPTEAGDAIGKLAYHCLTAAGDKGVGSMYVRQMAAWTGGDYVRGQIEWWLSGSDGDYQPKLILDSDGSLTADGELTGLIVNAIRPAADGPPYFTARYHGETERWAWGMDPADVVGERHWMLKYYDGSVWIPSAIKVLSTDPTKLLLVNADLSGNLSVSGIGKVAAARKAASTSRTSTTTSTGDPDLVLAVAANATYEVTLAGRGVSSSGFRGNFTWPAGTATFEGELKVINRATYAATAVICDEEIVDSSAAFILSARGILRTGGTAGNLAFAWSQQTSSGSPTSVGAGTTLVLRRIE